MQRNAKIVLNVVMACAAGYGIYRWYKWYKEELALEEQGITYDDILAEREAERMEKAIQERQKRMTEIEELEEEYDEESGEVASEDGHIWKEDDQGFIYRRPTREEMISGIDYDPLEEEVVEYFSTIGDEYTIVRKLKQPKFRNYRERRGSNDIIESVVDMIGQIRSLERNDMEVDKMIYPSESAEALDYYKALVIHRAGLDDSRIRNDLIRLFSWEWIPTTTAGPVNNIHEDIRQRRIEHFTFDNIDSKYVSVAELLVYFGEKLHFAVPYKTVEEYIIGMLEYMDIDRSDTDPVIQDTIIAYLEHGRVNRENYDDTYGIFGLEKEVYDAADDLFKELNGAVEKHLILDAHLNPKPNITPGEIVMDEQVDEL